MNEQHVRALAEAAELPLSEDRLALIAPLLSTWLDAANELSSTMAAAERQGLVPVTVFRHPTPDGTEE